MDDFKLNKLAEILKHCTTKEWCNIKKTMDDIFYSKYCETKLDGTENISELLKKNIDSTKA